MVMLDLPLSAEASARLSADITVSAPLSPVLDPSVNMAVKPAVNPAVNPSLDTQTWHVAVTRTGMFPMSEARCPCEKAPCGLVIIRAEVECDVHHPYASLHQAHSAQDCRSMRSGGRAARRASKRENRSSDKRENRSSDRPERSGLIGGLLRR